MKPSSSALLFLICSTTGFLACEVSSTDPEQAGGAGNAPTGGATPTGGRGSEAGSPSAGGVAIAGAPSDAGTSAAAGASSTSGGAAAAGAPPEAGGAAPGGAPAHAGQAGAVTNVAGASMAGAGGAAPLVGGAAGLPATAGAAGEAMGGAGGSDCLLPDPEYARQSDPCLAIPETTCGGSSGLNPAREFCFSHAYEVVYEVQDRMAECTSNITDPCADGVEEQVRACLREARVGICATTLAIEVCSEGGVDSFGDPYRAILESCDDGTLSLEACATRLSSFQSPNFYYANCMDPTSDVYDAGLDVSCADRLADCDSYD